MRSRALSKAHILPILSFAGTLLVCLISSASAKIADPTKSSHEASLVGDSSGKPVGDGYRATVRDISNLPLPGCIVSVIFANGTARPCSEQESGTTVDCTRESIWRITDGNGSVVFYHRVAGFDNSGIVEVRANGVLLGRTLVRSTDLDGNGTTDIRDLNQFRQRFLFDHLAPETDFDENGLTNSFDLNRLREEILLRARAMPCP